MRAWFVLSTYLVAFGAREKAREKSRDSHEDFDEGVAALCQEWQRTYAVEPQVSWGSLPGYLSVEWLEHDCDQYIGDAHIQTEFPEVKDGTVTYTLSVRRDGALGKWDKKPADPGTGMQHVRMCLSNLILLAQKLNRTALLPPPWLVLAWGHSWNKATLHELTWDRYYDLNASSMAAPTETAPLGLHEYGRGRVGAVEGAKLVEMDTP